MPYSLSFEKYAVVLHAFLYWYSQPNSNSTIAAMKEEIFNALTTDPNINCSSFFVDDTGEIVSASAIGASSADNNIGYSGMVAPGSAAWNKSLCVLYQIQDGNPAFGLQILLWLLFFIHLGLEINFIRIFKVSCLLLIEVSICTFIIYSFDMYISDVLSGHIFTSRGCGWVCGFLNFFTTAVAVVSCDKNQN